MRVLATIAFSSMVILAPVFAAAQTSPAPVAPPAPAAAAAPASAGVNLDEIVCRNSPPPTGSRLGGGRECHTQREWNQRQVDSQQSLTNSQRTGLRMPGG